MEIQHTNLENNLGHPQEPLPHLPADWNGLRDDGFGSEGQRKLDANLQDATNGVRDLTEQLGDLRTRRLEGEQIERTTIETIQANLLALQVQRQELMQRGATMDQNDYEEV